MTSTAALLVHGFGGDPSVWDPVEPALAERGVTTHRLALTGHPGAPGDLAAATAADWVADLERGLAELAGRADRVAIVGYSMGATLGYLALSRGLVDRAILVAPSLGVPAPRRVALAALDRVRVRRIPRGLIGANDDEQPALPVAALRANLELKAMAADAALADPAPTLLISAGHDSTVGPAAAPVVLDRFPVGTPLVTLAGADHDLLGGPCAARVTELIAGHVTG